MNKWVLCFHLSRQLWILALEFSHCLCSKSGSCNFLIASCFSFHHPMTKDDLMTNNYDSIISPYRKKNLLIEDRPGILTGYIWFLFPPLRFQTAGSSQMLLQTPPEHRPHTTLFPGIAGSSLFLDNIFLSLFFRFLPYFLLFSPLHPASHSPYSSHQFPRLLPYSILTSLNRK